MTKIAVIGGGRIGEALLAGLKTAGHPSADLSVVERFPERAQELAAALGVLVTNTGQAALDADVVVIAVKPHDVAASLAEIREALDGEPSSRQPLFVSLAAGITISAIEDVLPTGAIVVRVMPNTPMLVGQGMSVLAAGTHAAPGHLDEVGALLSSVGRIAVVEESALDAVTAVSGSGPAYFFLVVEAMVDAARELGLSELDAETLVHQTLVGAAEMVRTSTGSVSDLRAAVTSPGGTTAAAIAEFERADLRQIFVTALTAARDRSIEMGSPAS